MSSQDQTSSPRKEDLDAFLIGVESKLRGPFSSLDLTKAVAASALRSSSSPREYLQTIARVLPRMDKVVKLRVLVGLLGLEPSEDTDDVVYDILTQAQESPLHEEWVRVVAGLCRGVMFAEDGTRESCRGEEFQSLLEKTCQDILGRVNDDSNGTQESHDMDPLFAPYYYSLLDEEELKKALPECLENPHFQVNKNASILQVDEKLEQAKVQEEGREHAQQVSRRPANASGTQNGTSSSSKSPPVVMPGMRSIGSTGSTKAKPKAPVKKSSMFLQAKKPTASGTGGRLGQQTAGARKTALHSRKPGGVRALLAKGRRPGMGAGAAAGAAGGASSTGSSGRAMKYGNNRSKMKMIDVTEVQGLAKEHKERVEADTREQKMSSKKRKILEAAAAKGLVAKSKKSKPTDDGSASIPVNDARVNGPQEAQGMNPAPAASAPSEKLQGTATAPQAGPSAAAQAAPASVPIRPEAVPPPVAPTAGNQDWRQLLDKSNKLSVDDRIRVQAFFTDRFNPTPDVPVYKMKLHEEKTIDPATKGTVKETLYLELDYTTFGFKKLRKIKKK